MKIERFSPRLVYPRTPSPQPAQHIPLSSSDLAVPRVHVEVIYAFSAPPSTPSSTPSTSTSTSTSGSGSITTSSSSSSSSSSSMIEMGLAEVLCSYREWAGRLDLGGGRPSIVVNDAGAVFLEASADAPLAQLSPSFQPSRLLLDLVPVNRASPHLLLVQVTTFTCGGMTLGIARHHQVADGEAASEFMNAWGRTVRGVLVPVSTPPLHDRSALMPRDPPMPMFDHIEYKKLPPKSDTDSTTHQEYPELSINKINFSIEMLKKIKAQASKGASEGVFYSTFVSLLAHLWRCITKSRGLEDDAECETKALVAVNVRKRIVPPLPEGFFGNAMCHTCPHTTIKNLLKQPLSFAASIINASIKNITSDYVRSALDFIELQQKSPVQIARTNRTVLTPNLSVTSWVTLPLYELDFGWGTPIFAGNPFIPFEGLIILAPSHKKDGSIDVVLGLFAPDMARFEATCFELDE